MAHSAYFIKSMKSALDRKIMRRCTLIKKRDALEKEIDIVSDEISEVEKLLKEGGAE